MSTEWLLGMCMIGLVIVSCIVFFQGVQIEYNQNAIGLVRADGYAEVACGSDSMGLALSCRDRLLYRDVQRTEELINGEIYIFQSPYRENETVAHRLIWHDNLTAIFKGDNNKIADPRVNRSDVLYKVTGVEYYEHEHISYR